MWSVGHMLLYSQITVFDKLELHLLVKMMWYEYSCWSVKIRYACERNVIWYSLWYVKVTWDDNSFCTCLSKWCESSIVFAKVTPDLPIMRVSKICDMIVILNILKYIIILIIECTTIVRKTLLLCNTVLVTMTTQWTSRKSTKQKISEKVFDS